MSSRGLLKVCAGGTSAADLLELLKKQSLNCTKTPSWGIMKRLSIAMLVNLLELSISVRDDQSFITIPCQAKRESEVQYRRITWYKVEVRSEMLTGLVMKDLHTQETVLYKFANQSYEVGDDYSLLLPEAGQIDCGHYRCTLWPPLGHYIQDGDYEYYPLDSGCSRHHQQTKTIPDEKTKLRLFNVPVILAISILLAAGNMGIVYLSCKRIMQNKKAKQDMEYM
ncbi:uncharacterized protein LOC113529618 isoform X1 [Pangasianodon hypophthalmus]|uniref:uncharacterized protein LOC113529618 isoform X1 n=1 Tax=Pangasianodon hypophthalmus TaxID=310915 RepID=UPI000EFFACB5|nr:uncharacterized protein LOC113529618 isoform X1 [Pangasianodon hypophthalmus]